MKRYLIIQLIFILCIASPIEQIKAHPAHNQYANNDDDLTPFGKKKKKKKEENATMANKNNQPHHEKGTKGSKGDKNKGPSKESDEMVQSMEGAKGVKTDQIQSDSILTTKTRKDKPVYYAHVTKKNGWFVGIGKPLTLDQASHLNCYFKLSRKNDAGNWTFVEAFDGYGNPSASDLIPYLMNPFDDDDTGANLEWEQVLRSVCKWAFVADATGKTVVQEIAMDIDSATVFIFHPVKVNESEYLGSYTDKWGMPIYLRTDESGGHDDCASHVLITRDKRGFDVLVKYIDDKGCPQKNGDGAFMTQYEYQDDGNVKSCLSLDILGHPMIDECGNCGWVRTFKNGKKEEAFYVDTQRKPMRMPRWRENSETIIGYRQLYDQYGRDTTTLFIDANGQPDTNDVGIHKRRMVYNDHGQVIELAFYDLNGQLCPSTESEVAQVLSQFNARGHMAQVEYKDKNSHYVLGNGDYCKRVDEFEDDNEQIRHSIEYIPDESGDSLVKSFEYIKDDKGNETRTWLVNGYQRIDSVDNKGRNTLIAWYDLDGNPYEYGDYHKSITTYDDESGMVTEEWFDQDGDPCLNSGMEYTSAININDTINHITTTLNYLYSFPRNAFQKKYDPVSGNIIQQYDLTTYGEHARVGWWDNLHYISNVDYYSNGEIRTISGENEFGEPSYLSSLGTSNVVYYIQDVQGNRFYDEHCHEISTDTMDIFIQRLPRAYCIEVTDTAAAAYHLGLRNGDIIISYGNWTASDNLNNDMDDFYLETILQSTSPKTITLLRHHQDEKSSEIVKFVLPAGKVSDLGFYPHKIYYTQKEAERLRETCAKYDVSLRSPVAARDTTIYMTVQQKGSLLDTRFYHLGKNQDAGILLYAKTDGDVWSVRKGNSTLDMEMSEADGPFNSYFNDRKLILSHDLSDLCTLSCDNNTSYGLEIIPIKVSSSLFNQILKFYADNSDFIPSDLSLEEYRAMKDPAITEKKMMGKWATTLQVDDNTIAEFTLDLGKKHQATFSMKLKMDYEVLQLELICNNHPLWALNGVCLEMDFSDTTVDCQITKFEHQLDDEEQIAELQEAAEVYRQQLINGDIPFNSVFNEDYQIVKSVSKSQLKVMDGDTEHVFNRIM